MLDCKARRAAAEVLSMGLMAGNRTMPQDLKSGERASRDFAAACSYLEDKGLHEKGKER